MLLLAAMIWGSAFVAQRLGSGVMPAAAFTSLRHLLGALVLVPAVLWYDRSRGVTRAQGRVQTRRALVPGVLVGLALFVASYLQQLGIAHTTAGNAGFITGLYMVLVPVIGGLLLGHRSSRWVWVGVALALTGLYLLSVRHGLTMSLGDALMLGCAVAWAAQILLIDAYVTSLDPIRLAATEFAVCALVSLLVSLATEPDPFAATAAAALPLLYAGVLSTGLAFTLQAVAQRDTVPSTAAVIMSTESLFAAVSGALFLGERMDARGLLGCTLMLAGIVVAQRSPVRDRAGAADQGPERTTPAVERR